MQNNLKGKEMQEWRHTNHYIKLSVPTTILNQMPATRDQSFNLEQEKMKRFPARNKKKKALQKVNRLASSLLYIVQYR